jgi:hypothetical protein
MTQANANVVRYIVRDKPEGHRWGGEDSWYEIDKAKFARHDGESLCGTTPELLQAIAESEGLPESFVHDQGASYGFNLYSHEDGHLATAMEYSKRTGRRLSCGRGQHTLKGIAEASGKPVAFFSQGQYIIDGQWILTHSSVSYDPSKAASLLASKAAAGPVIRSFRSSRCRIPWRGGFGPICDAIYRAIDDISWFKSTYAGRSWRRRYLLVVRSPSFKAEALEHTAELAEFYFTLTRNRAYRTADFMTAVKLIAKKHLGDPQMTDEFKGFILKESKSRVYALKKKEKVT